MRTVIPEILTSDDPIPERVQLLRIHLDELRGREAGAEPRSRRPAPRLAQLAAAAVETSVGQARGALHVVHVLMFLC